jgi:hypothetical protein
VTQDPDALVFDTGPLRHFAGEGWLGVLKFLAGDRGVVIPESVQRELKRQVHDLPVLQQVLDAEWIRVDRSDDLPFLMAFANYEQRLAVGQQTLASVAYWRSARRGVSSWCSTTESRVRSRRRRGFA